MLLPPPPEDRLPEGVVELEVGSGVLDLERDLDLTRDSLLDAPPDRDWDLEIGSDDISASGSRSEKGYSCR